MASGAIRGYPSAKKSHFLKPAVRKRENARALVSQTTSASFFVLASAGIPYCHTRGLPTARER